MGNLLPRKISLSPGESDPSKITSKSIEGMAAGNTGDATEQQLNYQQISEEMARVYNQVQHGLQDFFKYATSSVAHQGMLEAKLAKCNHRLRRFAGDQARQGESKVENIASKNRPSVLESKYKEFCDHERMDAISALENERTGKGRDKWADMYMDQYIACIIFEEAYQAARLLKENFLRSMDLILMSAPSIGEQYFEQEHNGMSKTGSHQQSTISQIRENSLTLIMKETAENCDMSALVQRTVTSLCKSQEKDQLNDYSKDLWLKPKLRKYVEQCCEYAWKLVCQNPPYEINGNLGLRNNNLFNEAIHQVSRDPTSSKGTPRYIYAVIWPGLFRGSPPRIIQKTEVVLSSEK
ncbi:uncharacterized protein [Montipora capricornis]|uniref:uncharacterized protein isoform X2 n=1 Tax=Montipora capricornis TaxID=246305 RepID=UPI0035F206F4